MNGNIYLGEGGMFCHVTRDKFPRKQVVKSKGTFSYLETSVRPENQQVIWWKVSNVSRHPAIP